MPKNITLCDAYKIYTGNYRGLNPLLNKFFLIII